MCSMYATIGDLNCMTHRGLKSLFCSVPSRLPHEMGNLGQSSSLHAAKYDIPYAAEDMLLTSYQAVQYSRVYNGIDLHTRTGMEKMAR